jgi:tetratricopeptide (TPR) repeat protein
MKVRVIGRLAKAYAEAGKKGDALDTVKKLLAEVPTGTPAEAAAWLEAGGVYRKVGMSEEALKAFDRSIELSKKLAKSGWAPPPFPGGPEGPRSGAGGPPPWSGDKP